MSKPAVREHNHLTMNAWANPSSHWQTMTTRELRETLLQTDGQILARGNFWTIESKRIGPGVYRVTLKERL